MESNDELDNTSVTHDGGFQAKMRIEGNRALFFLSHECAKKCT